MVLSAILLAIAAIGGAIMLVLRLQGKELPPTPLALVHGTVAVAGVAALIHALIAPGPVQLTTATVAMAGLVIAAVIGSTLFFVFHSRHKALPVPVMLVHASVAVVFFIILLIAIFQG